MIATEEGPTTTKADDDGEGQTRMKNADDNFAFFCRRVDFSSAFVKAPGCSVAFCVRKGNDQLGGYALVGWVLQFTQKTQTLSLWHHRFENVLSQPGATFVMGFCLMEQKRYHGMPIMGILGHIKFPEYQLVQLM
ncbi:hypothetical protein RHMOL_Rhmol04G0150500 [Rhododendron molle]|uniref:Uncharacterized protein n=6 Tax=Rhododendron molle TaxID=49168 RepID=A0ACC0P0R7_RHOML|nr:hypothetical protein RHMOL_Rhmol04G0150500 [Rhododendron molle]KAI8559134.1 hypothetical protein RHMOL_Rhmol04G0150500 [Rhododendron molle]KAI8559135.1 hypothetical protein RHMOL_Rhmol04G0150500 [Rhododendron molle]KAI8559136.1 hypothetical protein RHMOL_Rhmol04G0150500 [Rhododendron molle]KAI8559137.1 hypothetical protein RHMOL_Rhmol04G0150500 [Rhododendron molle]